MSNPTGKQENAIWPMPQFYFKVTWGNTTISFSEVSGLDTEAQIIDYQHGDSKVHPAIKMPSIKKVGNVTMKRGVFVGDNTYQDWFKQIKLNTIEKGRETVTVQLLNENGKPAMTWVLNNAWPTKITSTDLKSDGNEVAIDTIEIAFETMVIKNEHNA
ncbi:MAG: phage tail protein [Bacteroidota bacterium]